MKNLDIKTRLFLFVTNAKIKKHEHIVQTDNKKKIKVSKVNLTDVYYFNDYNEYKEFFLMYFDDIEDELIKMAIYTKSKTGGIIAHKKLVERIIIMKQAIDKINSLTIEEKDEIHAKGKITAREAVVEWDGYGLCIPGDHSSSAKDRCDFFDNNCWNCMIEYASHKKEHDKIEFKIVNGIEKAPVKVKTM